MQCIFRKIFYSFLLLYLIGLVHAKDKIELEYDEGSELLKTVMSLLPEKNSTTAFRQENKWFVQQKKWDKQIKLLSDDLDQLFMGTTKIESRDHLSNDEWGNEMKNLTLTIYGKPFRIRFQTITSTVTFRIRFYLQKYFDQDEKIWKYKRSSVTSNKGYIEIKVKNPQVNYERTVVKLRTKLKDQFLKQIWNQTIDWSLLKSDNKEASGIFQMLHLYSSKYPDWAIPQFAVIYERSGSKIESVDNSFEYQLTVDRNIEFFTIPEKFEDLWTLAYDQKEKENNQVYCDKSRLKFEYEMLGHCKFPKQALAGEIKIPYPQAKFTYEQMDSVGQLIYTHFLKYFSQKDESLFPGMDPLRGKAGHFRNIVD